MTGAQWTILRAAARGEVWRTFASNDWHGPQQGGGGRLRGCSTTVVSLMKRGLLQAGRDEGRYVHAEPTEAGSALLAEDEAEDGAQ